MTRIAIQDANILIDLVNIDLFSHCLALAYNFSTTQLIFDSELNDRQIASIQVHIDSGKFNIIKTSADELSAIQIMSTEDSRLSEQDWSAIYYAQKENALLLSGDRILRKVSEHRGIEVCGILWLFDQLVNKGILSTSDACQFIQALMKQNKRLPLEECQKRINDWCRT